MEPETCSNNLSLDVGVNYTQLRNLLRDGKWREADEETYRVMIQASKREKENWLREEDIIHFPCTDLHTIDQLWMKYSKESFGFSIQKRLFIEVGGQPEEYDENLWDNFGSRVLWRVNNRWLTFSNLTFTLAAPVGHLPSLFTSYWRNGTRLVGRRDIMKNLCLRQDL